ncbi:hypothetical protein NVP1214O_46 [Vibrio phage 1.214.O._10N.222.54.F11]|nr:hypothetical protein NVP1013O_45 [Vibrio phage 1.013.O._10N.286.54.F9]AUR95895.1 hypothetical protein NVP1214O_46 [Vibrio phage 1.214.O._10N.222.54.F11]
MKKFIWTPTALTKLRKLSKTHTMQQAADEIGCTKNQVYARSRRDGISFRKYGNHHHSTKHSDHDVYLVRELVDSGVDKAEVARKMEVPLHAVSDWTLNKYRNHDSVQC